MAAQIHDLDLFGRNNLNGTAKELLDDDAINNTIMMWFTTKRGDFLRKPTEGGTLDFTLFKNITPSLIESISFQIQNAVIINFSQYVDLNYVTVIPDYENNIVEISILYRSKITQQTNSTNIYLDNRITSEKFVYEDVAHTGENLENFVLINLTRLSGKRLVYNMDEMRWVWGRFRFPDNWGPNTDPYFTRILSLINGSGQ